MKKVSAREFLHGFAKMHAKLGPGESVTITRHGKPLGEFTKVAPPSKISLPDFEKIAKAQGFGPKVGDQLLKRLLTDEAIS